MRTSVFAIFLSVASAAATSYAGGDEVFPGYDEVCGHRIVYKPTITVSAAEFDEQGRPVIVLDPILAAEEEAARRVFLIAHECAHHRMGHTRVDIRARRAQSFAVVRDHEMSADCWAAETLSKAGMLKPVRIMADRFWRAGLYSPGGGYPAGVQRSSIIQQCGGNLRRVIASEQAPQRISPGNQGAQVGR